MPNSSYQSISLRLSTTFSMLCYKSPALSILLAFLGVLHTALASPPLRPRFETNYTALSLKNASTYKKSRESKQS